MTSFVLRTGSPDETRAVAAALAPLLRAGDVVSMSGELGAGKTCFVQGAARALGVTQRVTSPTFLLVKLYDDAAPPLTHVDVYRLDRLQDAMDLGEEVMHPDRITFLEWGDAVAAILPEDRIDLELVVGEDLEKREIVLTLHGAATHRDDAVAAALHPWLES